MSFISRALALPRPATAPFVTPSHLAVGFAMAVAMLALIGGERIVSGRQSTAAPPFLASGVGETAGAVPLLTAPNGRALTASIPAGQHLRIGGELVGRHGILSQGTSYWVEVELDGIRVYGFLASTDVIVRGGSVPRLELGSRDISMLLAPSPAVTLSPMGSGAGQRGPTGEEASAAGALAGVTQDGTVRPTSRVTIAWLPETLTPWVPLIEEAAVRHEISADLVAIVMLVESGGDRTARSPSGATGLMQVMPGTGRDIAQRRGIAGFEPEKLLEPAVVVDFGAWYLSQQLRSFGLDPRPDADGRRAVELAAAAYNGGPGHVGQHLTTGQPLFAETQRYRNWVGGMWHERGMSESKTYNQWLEAGGARLIEAARLTQDLR